MLFKKLFVYIFVGFLLSACGGGNQSNGAGSLTDDAELAGLLKAPITEVQASRFLWKSTFGPTASSVSTLRKLGYSSFIDQELAKPAGQYNTYMLQKPNPIGQSFADYCKNFNEDIVICQTWAAFERRAPSVIFLKSAVHDEDQLRLKFAWALSQILVVSSNFTGNLNYGNLYYQQMLRNNAFGNYKDILMKISKNAFMGDWLDLAGSHKSNPNQNYARELLQLFSVGTFKRNKNGTFAYDSLGRRIENYRQDDILNFSKALTGWVYGGASTGGLIDYSADLTPMANAHDSSTKTLLNGVSIPAGRNPEQELQMVIDNVFHHESTAPNIVRQLIQFMVSSNPSPAYVARVVGVWNNNGQGVKGDLRAVARAILLDAEALNPPDNAGRLLEPVVAMTGLVRAIGGTTDGGILDSAVASMLQRPFAAPSVFNFYPPDFLLPLPGPKKDAPQFGIISLTTVMARLHWAHQLIFSDSIAADLSLPRAVATGTRLEWPDSWKSMAGTQVSALVEQLNIRLAGGALDISQRNQIAVQVGSLPNGTVDENLQRLRTAAWLVFSSPQFMAHR